MPERRPVEARSITGNGNATDPESIVELEDEWERRVRGQLAPPQKKFSKVAKESSEEKKEEEEKEPEKPALRPNLPKVAISKPGGRLIRI